MSQGSAVGSEASRPGYYSSKPLIFILCFRLRVGSHRHSGAARGRWRPRRRLKHSRIDGYCHCANRYIHRCNCRSVRVHGLFCWIIQIAEVTKFAHDVHERVAKLKETSPAVETLVNFVRDLME